MLARIARDRASRKLRSAPATRATGRPLTTDDIFKGKTVVVFSLPGAFTPTCSSTHVPRYNELAPAFFANGVDRIVCISVNDAFVMNEWARTQECGNITHAARRQRRVHREDGHAGRQDRPRLRQALLALLDAGARTA